MSSNPDSAPDVNATATAGNKSLLEIKLPGATTDGLVTYNLETVARQLASLGVLTHRSRRDPGALR